MRNEIRIARRSLHYVITATDQLQVLCCLLDAQVAIAALVIHFIFLLVNEEFLRLI